MRYEYRVVPAPQKIEKHRGAKTPPERFARTVESAVNAEAAQGWEFLRAETLPAEERRGLTSRTTVFHTLLVFRRPLKDGPAAETPARDFEPADPAGPEETRITPPHMRPLRPEPEISTQSFDASDPARAGNEADGSVDVEESEPKHAGHPSLSADMPAPETGTAPDAGSEEKGTADSAPSFAKKTPFMSAKNKGAQRGADTASEATSPISADDDAPAAR